MKSWKRSQGIPAVTALGLAALATSVSGCQVVEGIFKAGMWVGLLIVGLCVFAVFGVVSLMRR